MEKLTLQLNHIPDNWQALLQYLASLDFVDAIEFKGKTITKKSEPAEKNGISKPGYDLEKILKERNMTREEWDEIQRTIRQGADFSSIEDPVAWQRQQREDRYLPFHE